MAVADEQDAVFVALSEESGDELLVSLEEALDLPFALVEALVLALA